jgi:hypothetical protein
MHNASTHMHTHILHICTESVLTDVLLECIDDHIGTY